MQLLAWVLLASTTPAMAGYGGGGLVLHEAEVHPKALGTTLGTVACWGGQASRVGWESRLRVGADGATCRGPEATLHHGGMQLGWHSHGRPVYTTLFATVGAGYIQTEGLRRQGWRSAYGFARPTAGMGLPMGSFAIELNVFVALPVPVVQWVAGYGPVESFRYGGAELALMFGNFRKPPPEPPTPAPQPVPQAVESHADRPLALPPAQPIPPPPEHQPTTSPI